jgi:hypothetical protein
LLYSNPSVGQGRIYAEFPLAVIPFQVVSWLVNISKYQPVVMYDFFPVCGCPLFCSPGGPALAVGIEFSYEHHATTTPPDDFLPVQFPRWFLFCLPCSLFVNVYHSYHSFSPPFDVDNNYIVAFVITLVYLVVPCKTASLAHCHPHQLSFSNVVSQVADSASCCFSP